jgi:hypothetical protein
MDKMSKFSLYFNCPNCSSQAILSTNDGYRNQKCMSCRLDIVKNGILYTDITNKDTNKDTRKIMHTEYTEYTEREKDIPKYFEKKYSC